MSFRLSDDGRKYFATIDDNSKGGKFEAVWDKYYLCLMVGILNRKLGKETPIANEFEKDFIGLYKDQMHQIIAAFIAAERKRLAIPMNDAERLRSLMTMILDHTSHTNLSEEGHRRMNRYAEGGLDLIRERIPEPRELDIFLKEYYDASMNSSKR